MKEGAPDIRYEIFRGATARHATGTLIAEREGVLSGLKRASASVESLGLRFSSDLSDGVSLNGGQEIARVSGNPIQIVVAEERIIGAISKSSGIATAAHRARLEMHPNCRVVSGGGSYGVGLKAGEIILSGSAVPAVPVVKGDSIDLTVDRIGKVSCFFT
jgi:hypothetical protein